MSTNESDAKQPAPKEATAAAGVSDVESDPALNDDLGQDWADEGGATPNGPATSST
ncbi:hypothetical protein ACT3TS_02785 [Specibacter sp. AOP5-B1-6]|uniref:hypothetical protein n=1 Tax=Specibacter sp. AOP5-B1-6 TaxID=3457653 RepID=UPI00402B3DC2